jgi:hypothetical protein
MPPLADQKRLSQLTRSLILGASAGTISFVAVGCSEIDDAFSGLQAAGTPQSTTAGQLGVTGREGELCERALQTQSAADVNRLITEFPWSRCIAPVLNAAPSSTLAALTPQAVSRINPNIVPRLSPRVRAQLPFLQATASSGGGSRY